MPEAQAAIATQPIYGQEQLIPRTGREAAGQLVEAAGPQAM
jgi:hypothetical protein